jgi:hypothetical protein
LLTATLTESEELLFAPDDLLAQPVGRDNAVARTNIRKTVLIMRMSITPV